MSSAINEQTILDALRQVPEGRWGEVARFLEGLRGDIPPIRAAADLATSSLVGMWEGRGDLGDSRDFARRLRKQAEERRDRADDPGY